MAERPGGLRRTIIAVREDIERVIGARRKFRVSAGLVLRRLRELPKKLEISKRI
jgi:hypothetical protein